MPAMSSPELLSSPDQCNRHCHRAASWGLVMLASLTPRKSRDCQPCVALSLYVFLLATARHMAPRQCIAMCVTRPPHGPCRYTLDTMGSGMPKHARPVLTLQASMPVALCLSASSTPHSGLLNQPGGVPPQEQKNLDSGPCIKAGGQCRISPTAGSRYF